MPEAPVLVINTSDNEYVYMHSIDASEAVTIGDHRYATLEEQGSNDPRIAVALNRMRNVNINPPPELQTAEQKAAIRKQAAEEAAAQSPPAEPLGVRQALGAQPTPPPAPAPAPAEAPASPRRRSE